jgi:chromate transporter
VTQGASPPRDLSLGELFIAFLKIGVSGFGGTMVYGRRMMVEDWRWLTDDEFTDIWSLCQVLPGPNILNWSVCVGGRFRGAAGSFVAVMGMILAPISIVMVLGVLHSLYGQQPAVQAVLRGIAPVAAGLLVATALKMAATPRLRSWVAIFTVLAFLAVVAAKLPLLVILGALLPLSVAATWARRRSRGKGQA